MPISGMMWDCYDDDGETVFIYLAVLIGMVVRLFEIPAHSV